MNFTRISNLSDLIRRQLKRKPTIIIEPNLVKTFRIFGTVKDTNVAIDTDEWEVSEELRAFITELVQENGNVEEKILEIYKKLCSDYTYDDNILSYIKKNDDDTFFLPDAYGRDTDEEWKKNRQKHNRRNCFEISRILAKSIDELLDDMKIKKDYDVCIVWDEAVTHYLVGIASNDYYVTLDLDDFEQIKDLTRIKTGLTIEGITILEDHTNKFRTAVEQLNIGREKDSQDAINAQIENDDEQKYEKNIDSDDLKFIQYTIQILKEKYNLDSAGIFEYLKEIIDSKIGRNTRHTFWKKVDNEPGKGVRYTRCLVVDVDEKKYIIDVTENDVKKIFREYNKDVDGSDFIPFKMMEREWEEDPYDGR